MRIYAFLIIGILVIAAITVIYVMRKRRDDGRRPYAESDAVKYDPETMYAVIRSSICTGEKVAGFKNRKDGHFTEVMLIRTPEDEKHFREIYELESVRVEY